jgi:hypothetical protein
MWYINEDFEVEDAVYEGVKNIPMVIFFLREQSVKEKVLLWPFEKNVLCWESRVEECDRWLIEQRIFHAARTMLIYCHGLGYDPEAVIRKTMREFEVRFDYELLMEQYRRDLESRQFGSSLFIA